MNSHSALFQRCGTGDCGEPISGTKRKGRRRTRASFRSSLATSCSILYLFLRVNVLRLSVVLSRAFFASLAAGRACRRQSAPLYAANGRDVLASTHLAMSLTCLNRVVLVDVDMARGRFSFCVSALPTLKQNDGLLLVAEAHDALISWGSACA